jgi:cardiolipin synthase A/B
MRGPQKRGWFQRHARALAAAWAVFLLAAVALGILFIRRDTVEYYLDHKFRVEDPEFFPSAHALTDPLPITGNKIELLHNGRMIFPAMLEAIRGAKESVNFEAFLFHSGEVATQFCDTLASLPFANLTRRVGLPTAGLK